jgi:quinol monooxygenase YgiN
MSSDPVIVFATFRPRANKAQELEAVLRTMVTQSRQEPGCERYDLYEAAGESGMTYHLLERYRDAAALEMHQTSSHFRSYRASLPELEQRPVEVARFRELDVSR